MLHFFALWYRTYCAKPVFVWGHLLIYKHFSIVSIKHLHFQRRLSINGAGAKRWCDGENRASSVFLWWRKQTSSLLLWCMYLFSNYITPAVWDSWRWLCDKCSRCERRKSSSYRTLACILNQCGTTEVLDLKCTLGTGSSTNDLSHHRWSDVLNWTVPELNRITRYRKCMDVYKMVFYELELIKKEVALPTPMFTILFQHAACKRVCLY